MEIFAFLAAKQAKSPADVVDQLVDSGWSSSTDTREFAEEIFSRVPHKSSGPNVSSYSKFYQVQRFNLFFLGFIHL